MKPFPVAYIGNDELGDPLELGQHIDCPHCKSTHPIEGDPRLLTFTCRGVGYVAGVQGRSILHTGRVLVIRGFNFT